MAQTSNLEGAILQVHNITDRAQAEIMTLFTESVTAMESAGQAAQSTQMNPANERVRSTFLAKSDALVDALEAFQQSLSATDKAFTATDLESVEAIQTSDGIIDGVEANQFLGRLGG